MLSSQWRITEVQAHENDLADDVGLNQKSSFDLMTRQAGVRDGIGYTILDAKNYLRSKRQRSMVYDEADGLMRHLTVFTDQDLAMAKALHEVMPETFHGLCTWHLMQNGIKHLGNLMKEGSYFLIDFKRCMFGFEDEIKFEEAWSNLLTQYNLQDSTWLKQLYSVKAKWARCYIKAFTIDVKLLPETYILKNWTKEARSGVVLTAPHACPDRTTVTTPQACPERTTNHLSFTELLLAPLDQTLYSALYRALKAHLVLITIIEIEMIEIIPHCPIQCFGCSSHACFECLTSVYKALEALLEYKLDLDPKWLVDPKLLFVGPKIGEGAHAKVYEGNDVGMLKILIFLRWESNTFRYKNRNVAIKIVEKGDTAEEIAKKEARFAREVAMLSRVQHKNLVKFIGACKEPVMVIVTELLLGGMLQKHLISLRPRCLDIRVAIGFALDIARAMECLHSHGIIHRDLKPGAVHNAADTRLPSSKFVHHLALANCYQTTKWHIHGFLCHVENLLLTEDRRTVKLADFGLAREESLTEMMTAETGTYRWMAPELYSTVTLRQGEKKHYNHKVDAYSFAIVLWELIHNKLPFKACQICRRPMLLLLKLRNVRPSADELPEELARIVTLCWKEDADARPNFTQIIQMLLEYLSVTSLPEPAIPHRIFKRTSEMNAVFPPESPGTSSLMAKRGDMAGTPRGLFFCCC
ncbi:hypothetical protein SASPL_115180 [Salvia splendens]|uniref:Protein kinase domain-containing protein n=1 Tax=Salvia splendens TaxID=180675 RepID=A0A8X8Y711_SALSN|nr:hypothetical protein SASPL_115180 [Salvia splendens]